MVGRWKSVKHYFYPGPLSEILTIASLQHAASRIWTCKFRLRWMKLFSIDTQNTTAPRSLNSFNLSCIDWLKDVFNHSQPPTSYAGLKNFLQNLAVSIYLDQRYYSVPYITYLFEPNNLMETSLLLLKDSSSRYSQQRKPKTVGSFKKKESSYFGKTHDFHNEFSLIKNVKNCQWAIIKWLILENSTKLDK